MEAADQPQYNRQVEILYSIESIDKSAPAEIQISIETFEVSSGVVFYIFKIRQGHQDSYIKKRFENFKVLHTELLEDMMNWKTTSDTPKSNDVPTVPQEEKTLHILPELPTTTIDKVCQ